METCQIEALASDKTQLQVCHGEQLLGHIFTCFVEWTCRDGALRVYCLSMDELAPPQAESTEPRIAALARLGQWARAHDAQLVIDGLDQYDESFYQHITVCRFLMIHNQQDIAVWDRVLSMGLPIFGMRGALHCLVRTPSVLSAFQALLFGSFYASDGLSISLDEQPHACRITSQDGKALQARVIVRGGMELKELSGADIDWKDSGQEGYVRFELQSDQAQAWTQPRFVGIPGPQ